MPLDTDNEMNILARWSLDVLILALVIVIGGVVWVSKAHAQVGGGVTSQGVITPGDCADWLVTNVLVDSGSPCGGGGGGSGLAITATTGNTTFYPTFALGAATTASAIYIDTSNPWSYNPSTGLTGILGITTTTLTDNGNASLNGTTTISTPLLGLGSLTTSATTGFAYMPTSAGAPIGTPTSKSGYVPFEYDTTDNRFYIYSAGWSNIGISLSSLVGASSTNTFDNAALAQAWTWNTITTQTALSLSSTTITTGSLLTLTATAGTTGSTLNVIGNAAISGTTTLSTASVTDAFGANSSLSVSTTTITPNLTGGQNFIAQLTTACVCGIANPTNIASVVGQTGVIAVIQPASATTTVTWGSDYDFPDGTSPTLSTTTGAQDGFSYWVKDSTHIWVASGGLAFAP